HGPANAVLVAAPAHSHGPFGFGAGGITRCSGCPLSIRDVSGSGPFGPIFNGVWQSLQLPIVTRYSPRAICCCFVGTFVLFAVTDMVISTALTATSARMVIVRFMICCPPPAMYGCRKLRIAI